MNAAGQGNTKVQRQSEFMMEWEMEQPNSHNDFIEQRVPGYDPQLVAMQSLFLAAKAYSTPVGRA